MFALASALSAVATASCGRLAYGPPGAAIDAQRVAMGFEHGCVLLAGALACTGDNTRGQLGLADVAQVAALTPVPFDATLAAVSVGYASGAVLDVDGTVWTWGASDRGQLGRVAEGGPTLARVALPRPAILVSQRFDHGCAILDDASLHCWGSNFEGELGQDDPAASPDHVEPVRVPLDDVLLVSAGQGHTCAITRDATLHCWGRNTEGELGLGDGSPVQTRAPRALAGRWRSVVCGQSHTCAIDTTDEAYCWGADSDADGHRGPLGFAGAAAQYAPARVEGAGGWASLSTDTFHVCAVRLDGSLWCWGRNAEGQLGLGDPSLAVDVPRRIGEDDDWAEVAVGRFTTCARKRDGRTLCAGSNRHGELGVGDREVRDTLTPSTVAR